MEDALTPTSVLSPRLVANIARVRQMLLQDGYEVDTVIDMATQDLIIRIQRYIYSQKIEGHTERVVDEPRYKSPRHAWLSQYPQGSFRRRFFAYFWGIDPDEPLGVQTVHEFKVERWVNLPDLKVPGYKDYVYQQLVEHSGWTEAVE